MRGYALGECRLGSFDRQFEAQCRVQRPDRYRLLDALPPDRPRIARGGGVSYVAAGFGKETVSQDLGAFDRLLAFDGGAGRLTVEAGARIGDVQRFLLARGWYLPVAPGHPRASIGGCIAADVHGKNPARDGTFRHQVEAMEIHAPLRGTVVASRQRNPELFEATCGGLGLTGSIARVSLRLARPPSGLVMRRVPVANLAEAAAVLRESANARVLYGWHDGRAGRLFGRGVVRIGLSADREDGAIETMPPREADLPESVRALPVAVWNRAGIAAANAWLDWRWRRAGQSPESLARALFPLNGARAYFAGFGKAGMIEAQWLVPHRLFDAFAAALAEEVARIRPRITLIASKLFAGHPDGLSFDGHGIALAIQLAAPREAPQQRFLETLAGLALAHEGRPNPIKDSSLTGATARRGIAGFEAARERLAAHNPGGLHGSELSRRLAL